ncbi:MAG: DUF2202 domain-containing protein [Ilumatobacteraceae bacterium]
MRSRRGSGRRLTAVALFAAMAVIGASSCTSENNGGSGGGGGGRGPMNVGSDGASNVDEGTLRTTLDALPLADLTDAEVAGLTQMREEEKLAHDVYSSLGDQWGVQVFTNIASSEQTHADAVKALLDRYELADPADGLAAGEFKNQDLQGLYSALVEQGSASLVAALTVGATIEDLDIADLRGFATQTPDLALVYSNLERGSRNHLRAFTRQLTKSGATYTPAHISQADYDAIVAGAIERGANG